MCSAFIHKSCRETFWQSRFTCVGDFIILEKISERWKLTEKNTEGVSYR